MTALDEGSQVSTLITVDGWTIVQLAGDVDVVLIDDLAEAAKDAVALGLPVRVDVSEVTFMDSIGIGFLARLIAGGVRPQLVGASLRTIELVDVSGLAPLLDLG
jgi:anti-anti-sigma factor